MVGVGDTLATRYRIDEQIGAGGMAKVYRALDLVLMRDVALKVLLPHMLEDEKARTDFEREARIAATLSHNNLVIVHDAGLADGIPYIAMELLGGGTLRNKLQPGTPLPTSDILRISQEVLAGLAHAHEHKVFHGDMKPENVIFTTEGIAKVADFGIARAAGYYTLRTGHVLFTPAYVSPEQAKGQSPNTESDLYSWGVVMYEMATGRKPFLAEGLAVALMHMNDVPPTPRSLAPNLPATLEGVILKLLAKEPAERYRSAAEVQTALDTLINLPTKPANPVNRPQAAAAPAKDDPGGSQKQPPVVRSPEGAPSQPRQSRRRTNVAAVLGGALALVLIGAGVLLGVTLRGSTTTTTLPGPIVETTTMLPTAAQPLPTLTPTSEVSPPPKVVWELEIEKGDGDPHPIPANSLVWGDGKLNGISLAGDSDSATGHITIVDAGGDLRAVEGASVNSYQDYFDTRDERYVAELRAAVARMKDQHADQGFTVIVRRLLASGRFESERVTTGTTPISTTREATTASEATAPESDHPIPPDVAAGEVDDPFALFGITIGGEKGDWSKLSDGIEKYKFRPEALPSRGYDMHIPEHMIAHAWVDIGGQKATYEINGGREVLVAGQWKVAEMTLYAAAADWDAAKSGQWRKINVAGNQANGLSDWTEVGVEP